MILCNNQNQIDWKSIKQIYKPGILLVNYNPIRVRVFNNTELGTFDYQTLEADSVFLLLKPPKIETEQAMMSAIQLDMLQGEKIVQYFCYFPPWDLFDIVDTKTETKT